MTPTAVLLAAYSSSASPGVITNTAKPRTDQLIGSPATWRSAPIDQASGMDLEELQLCLGDSGAVTVAVCQIGDDWAVVRFRPGVPGDVDLGAGWN